MHERPRTRQRRGPRRCVALRRRLRLATGIGADVVGDMLLGQIIHSQLSIRSAGRISHKRNIRVGAKQSRQSGRPPTAGGAERARRDGAAGEAAEPGTIAPAAAPGDDAGRRRRMPSMSSPRAISRAVARRFLVVRHLLAPPRSLPAERGERARRRRPAGLAPVRPPRRRRAQPRPGAPRARRGLPARDDGSAAVRATRPVRGLQQGAEHPAAPRAARGTGSPGTGRVGPRRARSSASTATTWRSSWSRSARDGPTSTADLDRSEAIAWYWGPTGKSRAVLEALAEAGILGIARRDGNRRYYDLAERLFPAGLLEERVPEREQLLHRLLSRYRAHGLLGATGQAEIFLGLRAGARLLDESPQPRRAALLAELVGRGELRAGRGRGRAPRPPRRHRRAAAPRPGGTRGCRGAGSGRRACRA